MYPKQEPTYEHSSPFHVLSVVAQLCQTTLSTWDICSHSAKEEMLHSMAHLIEAAIALQEES